METKRFFGIVQEAYQILSNQNQKETYDHQLEKFKTKNPESQLKFRIL
jgi:curved DNA-binding protein CbpA